MDAQKFKDLLADWTKDPCFDLSDCEDEFTEEQKKEAEEYEQKTKARWASIYRASIEAVAAEHDCSFKTAEFIYTLKAELKVMREEIEIWKGYRRQNNID